MDSRKHVTGQTQTTQRTSLLVVFGAMFTTVGVATDFSGSYAVLSFISLGLGVVLFFTAAVLAIRDE